MTNKDCNELSKKEPLRRSSVSNNIGGNSAFAQRIFSWEVNYESNLVPRSHSVTGNVRSGKVRQYTIFQWPLKKGCGNAIYAPIGLFRFPFCQRRKSFTVKENHFKNLRRLCKWYRRKLHVPCHSNKVLRSLIRGTQKLINSS